ncbi:MAG: hypothetical protein VX966_00360 [Chloroflexota bacterium]|nr:hypothetical protein [Chloroflexota bacterium]
MTTERSGHYLKYALFCKDTDESLDDELSFKGIVDLIDVDIPDNPPTGDASILLDLDVHLAFCIAGATPGPHSLQIAIRAPGLPLNTPPPENVEWDEGIMFQRWIKTFRIPVQRLGRHIAVIVFDGAPLGEASFMVRFRQG